MKKKLRKAGIGGLAIIGVVVASVAFVSPVNAESSSVTRMTLVQAKPTLFSYQNLPGQIPGRSTYFVAPLSKPSGQAFGLMTGNASSIAPVPGNPEQITISLFFISVINFFWFWVLHLMSTFILSKTLPLCARLISSRASNSSSGVNFFLVLLVVGFVCLLPILKVIFAVYIFIINK